MGWLQMMIRRGNAYGQPDRKISVFFTPPHNMAGGISWPSSNLTCSVLISRQRCLKETDKMYIISSLQITPLHRTLYGCLSLLFCDEKCELNLQFCPFQPNMLPTLGLLLAGVLTVQIFEPSIISSKAFVDVWGSSFI